MLLPRGATTKYYKFPIASGSPWFLDSIVLPPCNGLSPFSVCLWVKLPCDEDIRDAELGLTLLFPYNLITYADTLNSYYQINSHSEVQAVHTYIIPHPNHSICLLSLAFVAITGSHVASADWSPGPDTTPHPFLDAEFSVPHYRQLDSNIYYLKE